MLLQDLNGAKRLMFSIVRSDGSTFVVLMICYIISPFVIFRSRRGSSKPSWWAIVVKRVYYLGSLVEGDHVEGKLQ